MKYNLKAYLQGVLTVDKNFSALLTAMRYAQDLKRANRKLETIITDENGKEYK